MYNIQVYVPYEKTAKYKENESLYYHLPIIPSLPVPTPTANWHTRTHTHTHTHTHEYETGSGWHVQINQKAWWKKCVFRLTLKVGREGGSFQVGRQWVPDSRSIVTKRTFTEGFQVCFWNFEQSFCRRTKGVRWLICAERRRQVWWKSAIKVTESERCELVLNTVFLYCYSCYYKQSRRSTTVIVEHWPTQIYWWGCAALLLQLLELFTLVTQISGRDWTGESVFNLLTSISNSSTCSDQSTWKAIKLLTKVCKS